MSERGSSEVVKRKDLVALNHFSRCIASRQPDAADKILRLELESAAQLSAIDYLGDVPWDDHDGAKDWYARLKSRPSFRALLADNLPGAPPPPHYADLDF